VSDLHPVTNPLPGAVGRGDTSGLAASATELNALAAAVPAAAIADVAGTTPAGGTGATAGAYDTAAHRDALIATVAEIKAQLNTLLAELRTAGIITP
jgi:hypothetical protein